jgi:hypothetical protein
LRRRFLRFAGPGFLDTTVLAVAGDAGFPGAFPFMGRPDASGEDFRDPCVVGVLGDFSTVLKIPLSPGFDQHQSNYLPR